MDMKNLSQWMDIAKRFQTDGFWKEIFEQSSFDDFVKNNFNFGENRESPEGPQQGEKFPPTDIYITDEEIKLVIELAGYVKDDIHLSVSGTKLLVRGKNSQIMSGKPVQQERYQGSFERIIELPEPTFPDQIRAKFTNGLLFVSYKRQFTEEEQVPID
jgi:HSP20 family protein